MIPVLAPPRSRRRALLRYYAGCGVLALALLLLWAIVGALVVLAWWLL